MIDNAALAAAAARARSSQCSFSMKTSLRNGESAAPVAGGCTTVLRPFAKMSVLALFRGDPRKLLPAIIKEVGASAVYWNRCYEPSAIARDKELKASLQRLGIEVQSFNGNADA